MSEKQRLNGLLPVFVIYIAFLFLFFWTIPLYPPDEPKYTYPAMKMLETGDYITPYFNCEKRLEKPILTYWLIALSYKIFGISDWSSRLPFIIISLILLLTIYKVANEECNKKTAIISIIFFCTTFQIFVYSKAIIPENPLLFFNTLSTFLFYFGLKKEEKKYIYFGYLSSGMAFLTKGPLGLIIPMGINLPFFSFRVGLKKTFRLIVSPIGIILFFLITLIWYGPVIYIHRWNFIEEFFILHNIKRFSGSANMHIYPFYYYIPVIIISLYIWLPYFKNLFIYLIKPKETKFESFLLWWIIFVFLFFSFSKNKLHHYILIMYPPLSILMAVSLEKLENKKIFSSPIIVLIIIFEFLMIFFADKFIGQSDYPVKTLFVTCLIFSVIILIINNFSNNFICFIVNTAKFFSITLIVLLSVNQKRKDIYTSLDMARELIKAKQVYNYERSAEDINHYLNICTKKLDDKKDLENLLNKKESFVLIIRGKDLQTIGELKYQSIIKIPNLKTNDRYILDFN